MQGELLEFPGEVYGMVMNLEEDNVGVVLLGSQAVGIHITAVNPVAQPHEALLTVDCNTRNLDLARLGRPRNILDPLQSLGVVDRDADVLATAQVEVLVAGIYLAVVNVDVAKVVGQLRMWEQAVFVGLYTLLHQVPVVVKLVETAGVGDVEIILIGCDALTSGNLNHLLEAILCAQVLCIGCCA